MSDPIGVHIWYPSDPQDDDEAWLTETAGRHRGTLSDLMMLSQPAQRSAAFDSTADADGFIGELTGTGRWSASRTGR